MNIRRATRDDAEAICALHIASIRELCSEAYSAEQVAAWTQPLRPDRYEPAMRRFEFFVAEEECIAGFCILHLEGAELNAVYLHPSAVGRGIGRKLLAFAERLARDHAITTLKLKSTLNAVGFYEACGYTRVRDAVHTNASGLELPCVEMKKAL